MPSDVTIHAPLFTGGACLLLECLALLLRPRIYQAPGVEEMASFGTAPARVSRQRDRSTDYRRWWDTCRHDPALSALVEALLQRIRTCGIAGLRILRPRPSLASPRARSAPRRTGGDTGETCRQAGQTRDGHSSAAAATAPVSTRLGARLLGQVPARQSRRRMPAYFATLAQYDDIIQVLDGRPGGPALCEHPVPWRPGSQESPGRMPHPAAQYQDHRATVSEQQQRRAGRATGQDPVPGHPSGIPQLREPACAKARTPSPPCSIARIPARDDHNTGRNPQGLTET